MNTSKGQEPMRNAEKLRNRFTLSEWSGAVGDLGTLLPLAFALIVYNGFSPARLFLLWGLVYLATGWFYKVPVSVQPLKAMSVIAIAKGFSPAFLSTAAFFYGILFILLAATGAIRRMQHWFSPALVRGIQIGIGLILAQKAVQLVLQKGFLLNTPVFPHGGNLLILMGLLMMIGFFRFRQKWSLILLLLAGGIAFTRLSGMPVAGNEAGGPALNPSFPHPAFLIDAVIFLIIPQLPLTLGNAVYAADDACHSLWKDQARRVNPTRLSFSIGLGDTLIGLLGGFPVCHGSGGMGAHAQFGAKTGGSTIIMGSLLVLAALSQPLSHLLFLVPIPLLAAFLIFDSWRMIGFISRLTRRIEFAVALLVGFLSFATHNLALALIAGLALEQGWRFYTLKKNIPVPKALPESDP